MENCWVLRRQSQLILPDFSGFNSSSAWLWPTGWQSTSCVLPLLLLIIQLSSFPPLSVLFWSAQLIPISQSCIHLQLINFWPVSTTVLAQHFAIYLIAVVRPFFSLFGFLGLKDCFYLLLTEEWVSILLLSRRCQGRFCLSHQTFSFTGWSGSTEPSGVCRSTIKHFILQALELFNAQGCLGKEID